MQTTIWTRPDWTKFWADPQRMHTYVNCKLEHREPTPEEIEELRIPLAIVEIKMPEEVYLSEPIQKLIGGFRTIYSGLDIRTYWGYTHIGNIDLGDIKKYISKEQYEQMKTVGAEFPAEVEALYTETENEEPTEE